MKNNLLKKRVQIEVDDVIVEDFNVYADNLDDLELQLRCIYSYTMSLKFDQQRAMIIDEKCYYKDWLVFGYLSDTDDYTPTEVNNEKRRVR